MNGLISSINLNQSDLKECSQLLKDDKESLILFLNGFLHTHTHTHTHTIILLQYIEFHKRVCFDMLNTILKHTK